ncbi:MAG: hypothetical protein Q8S09_01140, partial [Hyphomonas sp.]|nr:hypothetical protein [Hyphomonas sp.]
MPFINLTGERLGWSWLRCLPSVLAGLVCLAACVAVFANSAFAQTQTSVTGLPANAAEKPNGGGWACDKGFQAAGKVCVKVGVPANAHLTGSAYGAGWDCNYGFD